jgi:hypothetical protein
VPRHWAHAVVNDALHCRKCGYNLRGLQADGKCPECGLDIWSTVLSTVDPAAGRLPSLRNPPAVGNAILLLTICMLGGTVLLATPTISRMLNAWQPSTQMDWTQGIPELTWPFAALLGVLGAWALWRLAPPRGSEPHGAVWIDIWRVGAGLIGWLTFSTGWLAFAESPGLIGNQQRLVLHLAAAVFATIGLLGLRGVFGIIGQRSREYRRSRGGRQSLELIITAICAGLLAAAADYVTRLGWFPGRWRGELRMLCTIIIWMSTFMVLIGLTYLVMNAWWIRQALRRPPPLADQILMPQLPPDTWIPDRED